MPHLTRFAWLSVAAALTTIGLKTAAFILTGSIGLLSDALESLVNLVAALLALAMLHLAARPPDEEHLYGHTKAEYFASGAEGALILLAAASIAWAAIGRWLDPQPLSQVGVGLVVSALASSINLGVARVLLRAGRRYGSIALEADAHHLLTDVWTSAGVLLGVGAVALTGWLWLDPLLALAVALNIVWTGVQLVRRSALGLLDTALPAADQQVIQQVLATYEAAGIEFHALRTRQAGARRFISLHVLAPGQWTIQEGHSLLERLEADLRRALPAVHIFTHLEAREDPAAWDDVELDRG